MRQILIFCFLLINSGCALGLKMKILFVPTKLESFEQQKKFLLRHNLDTNNLYSINQEYFDSLGNDKYSLLKDSIKGFSPIQFRVYSKGENLHYGWLTCLGDLEYFLKDSVPLSELKVKDFQRINETLKFYNDLNLFNISEFEREKILNKAQKADYTIIYVWSAYLGKYSYSPAQVLESYIKKNSNGNNIYLIKLNISPL